MSRQRTLSFTYAFCAPIFSSARSIGDTVFSGALLPSFFQFEYAFDARIYPSIHWYRACIGSWRNSVAISRLLLDDKNEIRSSHDCFIVNNVHSWLKESDLASHTMLGCHYSICPGANSNWVVSKSFVTQLKQEK